MVKAAALTLQPKKLKWNKGLLLLKAELMSYLFLVKMFNIITFYETRQI